MECKTETVIFDTNIILQETSIIERAVLNGKKVLIPLTVLMELDKLKYDKNIGYIARGAIRTLMKLYNKYKKSFIFDTKEVENLLNVIIGSEKFDYEASVKNASKAYLLERTNNDFKIIATAKKHKACIITKDISMALIAESQGVNVELLTEVDNVSFNPYIEIHINSALNTIFKGVEKPFQTSYSRNKNADDLNIIIANIKNYIKDIFDTWRFIIIRDDEEKVQYIYAINPLKEEIVRIDNKNIYNTISSENNFKLKAKDEYQICAIYALKEAPSVLLLGKYGSGKSLLATAYGLTIANENQKKIFISRPNIGLDNRYDIGFLPGSKDEKLIEWLSGFLSATYFLYGNTKGQTANGNTFDYVKEQIFMSKFEIVPINMIQGASILEGDIFIVDEIQLINISYMTMLLSRINEGAKLIMTGDYKQAYDVIKPSESGILKLIKLFSLSNEKLYEMGIDPDAKKYLAIIGLKKYYRNKLTELADGLNKQII